MSTTTIKTTTAQFSAYGQPIFWRFVWKEFRMIRSLWAAVAIMGLLVQCAEKMLLPGSTELALTLLYTSLAAAALYSVGAAATTFSVEHEEETYDLLTRLPTTWWPLFAGKLVVTLVSALLLAGVLSISALMFRGPNLISEDSAYGALSVMGFAILEGITWGTLFSLLIKRPLLAAIVTLVIGTLSTTMAVNYASHDPMASLSPASYTRAIPLRVAIVAVVFTGSLLAARRWLPSGAHPALAARLGVGDRVASFTTKAFPRVRSQTLTLQSGDRVSRRRMLARLLWQTWRESWKLLLAPLGVALALIVGMGAATGLVQPKVTRVFGEVMTFAMSATLLFAPALYGAMAFYADQRRGNYRFLAEHAARPRYTWLARHLVWNSALVVVWSLMVSAALAIVVINIQRTGMERLDWFLDRGFPPNTSMEPYELGYGLAIAMRVATAISCGALAAYGVGQLFSMVVRSEILAAFLALLLAFVVAAWVWVVCLWQLSPVWFLLTLFAGLMFATWLRAPDWIAGRNSVRAWWKPAIAVIAPLLLVAAILPSTRLAQLKPKYATDRNHNRILSNGSPLPQQEFADLLAAFRAANTREAEQTADMYSRAAEKLASGSVKDTLEPWRKREYLKTESTAPPGGGEIDPFKIPPDRLPAFLKAQEQFTALIKQSIATAVNEAMEISQRPTCRFHLDPSWFSPDPPGQGKAAYLRKDYYKNPYHQLNQLIGVVAGEPMTTPDQPAARFLAALRMQKHLRSGQPTAVVIEQLQAEQNILRRIDQWAFEKGRTKEELRDVLDKLSAAFQAPESPVEALIADHINILAVIEGKDIPYILSTTPIAPHAYLAYLANQLWWERERAVLALDRITRRNIWEMKGFVDYLNDDTPRDIGLSRQQRWLRPEYGGMPELWEIQEPAAVTSYLVLLEYQARVQLSPLYRAYCDNLTSRRATLLQFALALYRLDQNKYPSQLANLVPDYLHELPLDPYAQQPFQYLPTGLSLPLKYWTTNGEHEQIEPGTPLFWSIGPGDARLKQTTRSRWEGKPDEPPPDGEEPKPEVNEPQYDFINEEAGWWNIKTLAFPLAK